MLLVVARLECGDAYLFPKKKDAYLRISDSFAEQPKVTMHAKQ